MGNIEEQIKKLADKLHEKGFTGDFFTQGTGHTDAESCIKTYLENQPTGNSISSAFPMRLSTFLEGNQTMTNYVLGIFKVDYHGLEGLRFTGFQAYRQSDWGMDVLNVDAEMKVILDIPSRADVCSVDFNSSRSRAIEPLWSLAGKDMPVITEKHMSDFTAFVCGKGYDGKFYGPTRQGMDLDAALLTYLTSKLTTNQQDNVFPFFMTTNIHFEPGNPLYISSRMEIDFERKGFTIKSYTPISWNLNKGITFHEIIPVTIKSIRDLPGKEKLIRIVHRMISNRQKKRKGKSKRL